MASACGAIWNEPRKIELPFTSSCKSGVVVLMPMKPPFAWKIFDVPRFVLDVQSGRKFAVPLPVGVASITEPPPMTVSGDAAVEVPSAATSGRALALRVT